MSNELIEERWPWSVNPKTNSIKDISTSVRFQELNTGASIPIEWDIPTRINKNRYDDNSNQSFDCEDG